MKAMLYADWMVFRQSFRSLLFVIVVFIATAFISGKTTFFSFIVVFLSIMTPTTLFAADKAYGWNRLSLVLPILRRDVVGSKFIMGALINFAMLAVGLVINVIYAAYEPSAVLVENIGGMLACEAVALLMMGVLMVLSFRFGIEKARYIIIACVWVPVLGMFVLEKLAVVQTAMHTAARWLDSAEDGQFVFVLTAALVVSLVVYALCCLISVRIYQKTEL
nr:ABC-2 transporter permease [uncultured Agathobaculum sp.]